MGWGKDGDDTMTAHDQGMAHDDDCLHCALWPVIHEYCRAHPDGVVYDVLMALAAVIGDQLASAGSTPYREEFIRDVEHGIRRRIKEVEEMRRIREGRA
jgi:hypothetical protein